MSGAEKPADSFHRLRGASRGLLATLLVALAPIPVPDAIPVPILAAPVAAQGARQAAAAERRTIEERTANMRKLDGFFPLYWDEAAGQLFMEISRFDRRSCTSRGSGPGSARTTSGSTGAFSRVRGS